MTSHERERLQRLQKRAQWLEERILKSDKDLRYDKMERSALLWAIQYIQTADKELGGFTLEFPRDKQRHKFD